MDAAPTVIHLRQRNSQFRDSQQNTKVFFLHNKVRNSRVAVQWVTQDLQIVLVHQSVCSSSGTQPDMRLDICIWGAGSGSATPSVSCVAAVAAGPAAI